jgi:hypothetical protein
VQGRDGTFSHTLKRIGYAPVEVGSADIAGIVVTIAPARSLNGRFRVEGMQEVSRAFGVSLGPSTIATISTIPGIPYPTHGGLNPDGTFRIDNVIPGEYSLNAWGPTHYMKSARFGTIDLLEEPFKFTGREQGTIEVLMSPNVASIEGTVTDRFAPAKGVQVVLVPDKARHRVELFKNTVTDQNGRFSMRNLAPGDYTLYVWEAIEPYSWFDPEVLKRYEQSGQRLHLTESARQTVDPRLISAP